MNTRALNLFKFIRKTVKTRSKVTYDISKYELTIPFHSFPLNNEKCQVFYSDEVPEQGGDIYLSVTKADEPTRPEYPELCMPWLQPPAKDLYELPPLAEEIITLKEVMESDEEDPGESIHELALSDHPEVLDAWTEFVEFKWEPWVELHRHWSELQNLYERLFHVHQQQKKLGEQFELVLGVGLFTHESNSGKTLRRHLLTQKIELDFDAERGVFEIRQHDSANVLLELEMLEDRPRREIIEHVEEQLANEAADILSVEFTEPILRSLVQGIYADGQYDSAMLDFPTPSCRPRCTLSPVLILRKRNTRGLVSALDKVVAQLETGEALTPGVRALIGEPSQTEAFHGSCDTGKLESDVDMKDSEVYFPLPTNEQQKKILDRFRSRSGVVVKGPPGTGKSHTIANLISHLLAAGERVLVTAESPRALSVLQGKLPEALQGMAVSLLGNGAEEKKNLEHSINELITLRENWSGREKRLDSQIKAEEKKLVGVRKRLARARNIKRDLDTQENGKQNVSNGYDGYPSEIAEKVVANTSEFEWFVDCVAQSYEFPITPECLIELAASLREIPQLKVDQFVKEFPAQQALSSLRRFPVAFTNLQKAKDDMRDIRNSIAVTPIEISALSSDEIESELGELKRLTAKIEEIGNAEEWVDLIVDDCQSGRQRGWADIAKDIRVRLEGKVENLSALSALDIELPENLDGKLVRRSVADILRHFRGGGKRRKWGILIPKVIKDNWETITACRLDGLPCDSREDLETLFEYLEAKHALAETRKRISGWVRLADMGLMETFRSIQAIQKKIMAIVYLHTELHRLYSRLGFSRVVAEKRCWDTQTADEVIDICKNEICRRNIASAQDAMNAIGTEIKQLEEAENIHPLMKLLSESFRELDVPLFIETLDELADLAAAKTAFARNDAALCAISRGAPLLVEQIRKSINDPKWGERLKYLADAWEWARAKKWLSEFLQLNSAVSPKFISDLANQERTLLTRVGSLKATKACLKRLTSDKVQALIAWRQAMDKLGRGTGKYSPLHRRNARKALDICRDTIPAWIMPLRNLFETVEPTAGMFDVVIIDEASQCNIDSLLLFYLAKKIIIVGDPEQISPLGVGQNLGVINNLREEHLSELPELIRQSFDLTTSLHDLGNLVFPDGELILQEHFRSVPEIISFSNNLCYGNRLIPLRQPESDRLPPLKRFYIDDGFREGSGSKIFNRSEAEEICLQIQRCCNDPKYDGKTIGVIALQGHGQATLIQERLLQLVGAAEMEKRRILCGDPYSFQGDERDVIFLSMVVAPNVTFRRISKKSYCQRYNVAVSRARDQVWLFHSIRREELHPQCLRRQLIEHFNEPDRYAPKIAGIKDIDQLSRLADAKGREIGTQPAPFDSWFEVDVALELARRGYSVSPQFPSGGKVIDLVVQGAGRKLAIECHGPHHLEPQQIDSDEARQQLLERIGWRFHIVWSSHFYADRESIIQAIVDALSDNGIYPASISQASEVVVSSDIESHESIPVEQPNISLAKVPSEKFEQIGLFKDGLPRQSCIPFQSTVEYPLPDPREATDKSVVEAVRKIIHEFGPLPQAAVYRRYRENSRLNKISRVIKNALNSAIDSLVDNELVIEVDEYANGMRDERILRGAGTEAIRLRDKGQREFFEDIPPSEIAAVMSDIALKRGTVGRLNKRHLTYPILHHYGFDKLTSKREPIIEAAYRIYCQGNRGSEKVLEEQRKLSCSN